MAQYLCDKHQWRGIAGKPCPMCTHVLRAAAERIEGKKASLQDVQSILLELSKPGEEGGDPFYQGQKAAYAHALDMVRGVPKLSEIVRDSSDDFEDGFGAIGEDLGTSDLGDNLDDFAVSDGFESNEAVIELLGNPKYNRPKMTRESLTRAALSIAERYPNVYTNPHPDFIKKVDGIGPGKKGLVQFLAGQPFRLRSVCAINTAAEWWSVSSIKIGGQEQFVDHLDGAIKLSLLRGRMEFMSANPGMMIEITVINDTSQVRSIEMMLEGQYVQER